MSYIFTEYYNVSQTRLSYEIMSYSQAPISRWLEGLFSRVIKELVITTIMSHQLHESFWNKVKMEETVHSMIIIVIVRTTFTGRLLRPRMSRLLLCIVNHSITWGDTHTGHLPWLSKKHIAISLISSCYNHKPRNRNWMILRLNSSLPC